MHQATLDMKLEVLRLGKLLSHNRALYHATTRQMTHTAPLWTAASWDSWCEELQDAGTARTKADLPMERARLEQKKRVRRAAKKKPATAAKTSAKRHRTPHTLSRQDSMVRGGKKPCR